MGGSCRQAFSHFVQRRSRAGGACERDLQEHFRLVDVPKYRHAVLFRSLQQQEIYDLRRTCTRDRRCDRVHVHMYVAR
jgi:hypothetical protein